MPWKPRPKICKGCETEFMARTPMIKFCSLKCANSGVNSPLWKGDNVGIDALHAYVRKIKPKPELCECCQSVPPYDLANITNLYKRDPSDWEWLCRKCHMTKDGRMNNLKQYKNQIL